MCKTAAGSVLDGIRELLSPDQVIPEKEYLHYEQVFQNDFYYMKDGNLEQTRELLHKILIEVSVEYGFDFTGNKEFCDEMTAQLNGTEIRARKKQDAMNPVLAQIRFKYPLEYDIAIFFADRFHRLTGLNVSEDEVGQFAVHFIWGMETGFEKMQQKLALINPFGKQTNELMEKRLQKSGNAIPSSLTGIRSLTIPAKCRGMRWRFSPQFLLPTHRKTFRGAVPEFSGLP